MAGRYFKAKGSPWNEPLPADVPISPDSDAIVQDFLDLYAQRDAWGFISSGDNACPIYEVDSSTPRVPVYMQRGVAPEQPGVDSPAVKNGNFETSLAWINQQGVPIPDYAVDPGTSGDHPMCVIDTDTGELWEWWKINKDTDGRWVFRWGGYMNDHRQNIGRFEAHASDPTGYEISFANWGCTATSLPHAAGVMLHKELNAGLIPHAIHFVYSQPKNTYVWPAQRSDGSSGNVMPEGTIMRIDPSFDIDSLTVPQNSSGISDPVQALKTLKAVAKAVQDYGMILSDKAGGYGFRGEPPVNPVDGATPYVYGGSGWAILEHFPIASLQVVDPSYRPDSRFTNNVSVRQDGDWLAANRLVRNSCQWLTQ